MRELRNYYKDIDKLLPLDKSYKKEYICKIKSDIEDYLQDHPESGLDEVVVRFGTPQIIVARFLEAQDEFVIVEKIWKEKWRKKKLILLLIIIIFITVLGIGYICWDTYNTNHGYLLEEINN